MGLDAFVRCNCWRDGKTKPLPISRELMKIDENGYFDLALDYEGNEAVHALFDDWCEYGCEHEGMHIIHERVCNWSGKRYFGSALERAGIENFPVLWNEFPQANAGQLSPQNAARALEELQFLRESADLGFVIELVEEGTDELIKDQSSFAFGQGESVVVNEQGLLVVNESEKVLFAARRIGQIALDEKRRSWTNLDSGESFETEWELCVDLPWPDGKWENEAGLSNRRLVETARQRQRPMTPLDLDYILAPLTRLFEASVKIGNPVIWT